METLVCIAMPQDFDRIMTLFGQLWPTQTFDRDEMRKTYLASLDESHECSLCAHVNGELAGFVHGVWFNEHMHQGRALYISTLVVDEEARGRQIGRQLMDEIIAWGRGVGCKAVELASAFHRGQAHDFYERYGFEKSDYTFTMKL